MGSDKHHKKDISSNNPEITETTSSFKGDERFVQGGSKLTARDFEILLAIEEPNCQNATCISRKLGISRSNVSSRVQKLVEEGLIVKHSRLYYITNQGVI